MQDLRSQNSCWARKNEASYNFTFERSKVYFIQSEQNAKATELLDLMAGAKNSFGQIEVRDSSFLESGKAPLPKDALAYRAADFSLDGHLTAVQHLNFFANLRGSQVCNNILVICEKMLPSDVQVQHFSDS